MWPLDWRSKITTYLEFQSLVCLLLYKFCGAPMMMISSYILLSNFLAEKLSPLLTPLLFHSSSLPADGSGQKTNRLIWRPCLLTQKFGPNQSTTFLSNTNPVETQTNMWSVVFFNQVIFQKILCNDCIYPSVLGENIRLYMSFFVSTEVVSKCLLIRSCLVMSCWLANDSGDLCY